MKQKIKTVPEGNFDIGKVVFRYSDGKHKTQTVFVDGTGDDSRVDMDKEIESSFFKINENYFAHATPRTVGTEHFVFVRLFKKIGANFNFKKSFEYKIVGDALNSIRGANISENRAMIAYYAGSGGGKALVLSFNAFNETFDFSSEFSFLTSKATGTQLDIIKIATDRTIIAFGNVAGNLNVLVATYSAPTIHFGTSVQLTSTVKANMVRIAEHDTNKFVVVYNHVAGYQLTAAHISVNGTSITALHTLVLETTVNTLYNMDLQAIAPRKLVLTLNSNHANHFAYRTALMPILISETNELSKGTVVDTGLGSQTKIGLSAYDKNKKALYIIQESGILQKWNFNETDNTFREDTASKLTSLYRIKTLNVAGTLHYAHSRVIPIASNEFVFYYGNNEANNKVAIFFILNTDGFDKPEIVGVARNKTEVVTEGIISGMTGLVAGEKYYTNTLCNLVTSNEFSYRYPMLNVLSEGTGVAEDNFIGIAISSSELVIPKEKESTYLKSI